VSTRYTCLKCKEWLSRCTCAGPSPSLDEVRPIRSGPWTREEVSKLLQAEADLRQEAGRQVVRSVQAERRRRR
jgi:hypothetical protein